MKGSTYMPHMSVVYQDEFPHDDSDTHRIITPVEGTHPEEIESTLIDGDCLTGDEIYRGDYVISRINFEPSELTPGRLVLAKTPDGLKVRHYYSIGKKIRLKASNEKFPDLVYEKDQVEIRGIWVRTDKRS